MSEPKNWECKAVKVKRCIYEDEVEIALHPYSLCASIRVKKSGEYEKETTSWIGIKALLELVDKLNKIRPEWVEEMIARKKDFITDMDIDYPEMCSKCKGKGYRVPRTFERNSDNT